MYKLIISPLRYSAIVHASHLLDNRSVLITLADGMEEPNIYELCLDAKRTQKRFEVEKAYKIFGIRQLYCFNQNMNNIDYEFVLLKLNLMLAITPFTHLCYEDLEDPLLIEIFKQVGEGTNKVVYTSDPENSLSYELNDEEIERKLDAIQRMPTIRKKLLYMQEPNIEYLRRTI